MDTKQWNLRIGIREDGDRTYAEASLTGPGHAAVVGVGRALLQPGDRGVPEIGDRIAVARALADLSERLLMAASAEIAVVNDRTTAPITP